jgi:hypothetical protein
MSIIATGVWCNYMTYNTINTIECQELLLGTTDDAADENLPHHVFLL